MKKYQFNIEYFQGVTCGGCSVLDELDLEVEFADNEIALMRQLVSQLDEVLYSEGIMPVLKDGAPNLYNRMEQAVRQRIFDWVRARYSVDDSVCMDDEDLDYTVDIPTEFL